MRDFPRRKAAGRHVRSARRPPRNAIVVFARVPAAGRAKTRLIPLLGARGAAALQAAFLSDTLRKVKKLGPAFARYLYLAGGRERIARVKGFALATQRGADLGARLANSFEELLVAHERVVTIGTDSPELSVSLLRLATRELNYCEAVLGPCPDGGFYVVGLKRKGRRVQTGELCATWSIFSGVRWGTRHAFRDVLRNALRARLACSLLPPAADVDRPRDLKRLQALLVARPSLRRLAPDTRRLFDSLGLLDESTRR